MLKKMLTALIMLLIIYIIIPQTDVSAIPKERNVLNRNLTKTSILEGGKVIQTKTNNPTYNPYDITEVSNASYNYVYESLKGTKLQNWTSYFIQGEEKYKINLFLVVGIVAEESGWGKSRRANDGSFNLTGHGVPNNSSRGSQFNSYEECIYETFRLIAEDYIKTDGKFYCGGTSIYKINNTYSENTLWSTNINSIIFNLINKN